LAVLILSSDSFSVKINKTNSERLNYMKSVFKSIIVAIITWEAKILLKRKKPTVIAITGSVGKTSAKDAIYTVLKDHVHARKSQKSYNSEIGVPLSVLGLKNGWSNPLLWLKNIFDGAFVAFFASEYPKVLVLEIGVDRPGDMKDLTSWLTPDIVVLTRLPDVPVHVEYFATPEAVIAEKMQLVQALSDDGILIYNNDDQKIREEIENVRQQSFGFSRYSPSHFTTSDDEVIYKKGKAVGVQCTLRHIEEEVTLKVFGSLGVQHAYNYAAAVAVGVQFDIALQDASDALAKNIPPAGRIRIIEGVQDTLILDDTYNSSPVAAEQALQTVRELDVKGRKIVVLGDMLELGRYSVSEHDRIGEIVAKSADILLTLGVRARNIAQGALDNGMSEKVIFQYDDINRAGHELLEIIEPNDLILVKASQGMRAERLVERLMKDPDQARQLLCRQGKVWLQK
jgi:UDP-N-acetylmuramoyl-tripeptide--D-alanyl-D-alanine ligase